VFLLDTHVISELRKAKPHGEVLSWMQSVKSAQKYLCAVTVGETQAGLEITRAQDPAKAQQLEAWLEKLTAHYDVLPMDALAFREWARLMHRRSNLLSLNAMIAAIAKTRGLTLATRNTSDFKTFGVTLVNPFKV
jgi:toxin FitB